MSGLSLKIKRQALVVTSVFILLAGALTSGCNSADGAGPASANGGAASVTNVSGGTGPTNLPAGTRKYSTDVLLYAGDGSWAAEVSNLENLFDANQITYQAVSSSDLNSMSLDQISNFGTILWVGGEAGTQADSLSAATKVNLRTAVKQNGVSWLGFCAGSFIAVEPLATVNSSPDYGLSIVDGPILQLYYLEAQDEAAGVPDYNLTMESFPDGSSHNILWYGGPVTPSGSGMVVAKYPTGEPAISEMWSGNGLVILSGVHPTASDVTLNGLLGSLPPDGNDLALALKLVQAAIHQAPLPTF